VGEGEVKTSVACGSVACGSAVVRQKTRSTGQAKVENRGRSGGGERYLCERGEEKKKKERRKGQDLHEKWEPLRCVAQW